MGNKFSGMTSLEIVETLLFERNPSPSEKEKQDVWNELVARGLDPGYHGIGQAMDMAGGGSTYLGTRDSAIEFMKRCLVLAETRGAHNAKVIGARDD
jgi:hypothetical protein